MSDWYHIWTDTIGCLTTGMSMSFLLKAERVWQCSIDSLRQHLAKRLAWTAIPSLSVTKLPWKWR